MTSRAVRTLRVLAVIHGSLLVLGEMLRSRAKAGRCPSCSTTS